MTRDEKIAKMIRDEKIAEAETAYSAFRTYMKTEDPQVAVPPVATVRLAKNWAAVVRDEDVASFASTVLRQAWEEERSIRIAAEREE